MPKERLDVLVKNTGNFSSGEKARAAIMAGFIFVDGERRDKPGMKFDDNAKIEIRGKINPYVSRGGYKLEKAITVFDINMTGLVAMDAGASTGGFTDCMLQNGARKVYSVDVGYGQLAYNLRIDPRVVCMERTNVRYLCPDDFSEVIDFFTVDVSFISLKKVIPSLVALCDNSAEAIALIKPQFEAGREKVGKNGVVRDKKIHEEVIRETADFIIESGLVFAGLTYSPIKGPEGNIEYLIYFTLEDKRKNGGIHLKKIEELISGIVNEAHIMAK